MKMIFDKLNVDKTWTLFLDRDGVINKHLPDDYVKTWEEFTFNEGVFETLKMLSQRVGRIIIVTNQQGIGKGLMTEDDLQQIHTKMLHEIKANGGRIDAVFHAPHKVADDVFGLRKPSIGMALKAKQLFDEIDFSKSIMVGDTAGDMQFGKNVGMKTVFVNKSLVHQNLNYDTIDFEISALSDLIN